MIKEKRKKKKLTQAQLAKKIGIDFSYLSKLENHPKTQTPSLDIIFRLSDVLELDPYQLMYFFYKNDSAEYRTLVTVIVTKKTYNKLIRDAKNQNSSINNVAVNILNEHYKNNI